MSNQVNNTGIEQQSEDNELAEFNKILSSNFDLLPLFERQYFAFVRTRLYSMRSNEKLRKRWRDRMRGNTEEKGVRTMPGVSDYHFYNCRTTLMASQSPANFPTLRRHLVPGPGVDKYGQKPIPADMMLRKPERKSRPPAGKNKSRPKESKEPAAK